MERFGSLRSAAATSARNKGLSESGKRSSSGMATDERWVPGNHAATSTAVRSTPSVGGTDSGQAMWLAKSTGSLTVAQHTNWDAIKDTVP
jgi:hypothetical protein